jgi:O-antigen/teichoic acid export membrane protein
MRAFVKKFKKSTVAKNFSYITLGSILAQLINLFSLVQIARIFRPDDYGVYTFLITQAFLLYTLGELGIRTIVIRTIARNRLSASSMVYNGMLLRTSCVLLFFGFYAIYNFIAGSLSGVQMMLIFFFALSYCISNLFEAAFWGQEKMLPPAIINVSTSLIWLALVYLLPVRYVTVNALFFLYFLINLLTGVSFYIILRRLNLLSGKKDPFVASTKTLLRQSWPYFSLILLGLPISYLSNNFLDINSLSKEIGYFNLAQKLTSPVSLIIGFSLSAIFPNMSSLWLNDENRFARLVSRGVRLFLLFAVVVCFNFTLFAEEVVLIFFSEEYFPVIDVCRLQIWYVFLMGFNSLIGTIWGATNKERLLFTSSLVNAVISTPLLYWGSFHGALGLSYGYVISFAIFEFYLWFLFRRTIKTTISQAGLLWLLVGGLFVASYFFLAELQLLYRIIAAVLVLGVIGYYFFLKKKASTNTA